VRCKIDPTDYETLRSNGCRRRPDNRELRILGEIDQGKMVNTNALRVEARPVRISNVHQNAEVQTAEESVCRIKFAHRRKGEVDQRDGWPVLAANNNLRSLFKTPNTNCRRNNAHPFGRCTNDWRRCRTRSREKQF